ncbi:uncharacterized protein LOC142590114 isoform X1 [Dermacentor variabilis]|uniref:uncharacterized protein LOC142590114 isoform X1 n=1 Tax=Dermacentor variabilis TaxID=34621 RepID=UPI003F5BDA42
MPCWPWRAEIPLHRAIPAHLAWSRQWPYPSNPGQACIVIRMAQDASRPSSRQAATVKREKSCERRRHHCNFCDYKTDRVADLKRHAVVHTGERPFECHLCPQTFSLKSNLKAHLRTHTGEKPFRCPSCPQGFLQKSTLNRHLRTHAQRRSAGVEAEYLPRMQEDHASNPGAD